jgi:endonuclease III
MLENGENMRYSELIKIGIERFNKREREGILILEREEVKKVADKFLIDIDKAKKLLNDIDNNPHAFVLACLMDRQIPFERAWLIPPRIFDIIGSHDFSALENITFEKYKEIFSKNRLHRYNNDMAKVFYNGIRIIKAKYDGNASKIWTGKPNSKLVVDRFLKFHGCGQKIATMAANMLATKFKIEFLDYYSIDISPDVHIMRVFARMGLVPPNPSPKIVIEKARELYPNFPGITNFYCWEIGNKYCHKRRPDCKNCIIGAGCEKRLTDL